MSSLNTFLWRLSLFVVLTCLVPSLSALSSGLDPTSGTTSTGDATAFLCAADQHHSASITPSAEPPAGVASDEYVPPVAPPADEDLLLPPVRPLHLGASGKYRLLYLDTETTGLDQMDEFFWKKLPGQQVEGKAVVKDMLLDIALKVIEVDVATGQWSEPSEEEIFGTTDESLGGAAYSPPSSGSNYDLSFRQWLDYKNRALTQEERERLLTHEAEQEEAIEKALKEVPEAELLFTRDEAPPSAVGGAAVEGAAEAVLSEDVDGGSSPASDEDPAEGVDHGVPTEVAAASDLVHGDADAMEDVVEEEDTTSSAFTYQSYQQPDMKRFVAKYTTWQRYLFSGAYTTNWTGWDKVKGQKIDWERVGRLIQVSDYIVAHNADYDYNFVVENFPPAAFKPWICSYKELDWKSVVTARFGEDRFTNKKAATLAALWDITPGKHDAFSDITACIKTLEASGQWLALIRNAERRLDEKKFYQLGTLSIAQLPPQFESQPVSPADWDRTLSYWRGPQDSGPRPSKFHVAEAFCDEWQNTAAYRSFDNRLQRGHIGSVFLGPKPRSFFRGHTNPEADFRLHKNNYFEVIPGLLESRGFLIKKRPDGTFLTRKSDGEPFLIVEKTFAYDEIMRVMRDFYSIYYDSRSWVNPLEHPMRSLGFQTREGAFGWEQVLPVRMERESAGGRDWDAVRARLQQREVVRTKRAREESEMLVRTRRVSGKTAAGTAAGGKTTKKARPSAIAYGEW